MRKQLDVGSATINRLWEENFIPADNAREDFVRRWCECLKERAD